MILKCAFLFVIVFVSSKNYPKVQLPQITTALQQHAGKKRVA
jgi:hypothetical protein